MYLYFWTSLYVTYFLFQADLECLKCRPVYTKPAVVAHTRNPSTESGVGGMSQELKASLNYKGSPNPALAKQDLVSKPIIKELKQEKRASHNFRA